ncbi:hypothetical protein [Vibrio methylphosphonaticus]|uniref:hypothetical protein n=1 Tax=Vibrio methylphosphonaticus TaxID=2946866 RepID=UPI00202A60E2|nr:hypothetical protein [Vibrio methylphosphonaticus]MCL9774246.1 hypothetical protein [Vibrio methylphosphonaticus]
MFKVVCTALLALTTIVTTGCVTRKIPVDPEAAKVMALSEFTKKNMNCEQVEMFTFEDGHPNNFYPYIKNTTYMLGGTHFHVDDIIKTRRDRPAGADVSVYYCQDK